MAKAKSANAQLDAYYQTLAEFAEHKASHEGAVSTAFQTLLADTARRHHWTLIPQLGAEGIRPDGTLKDPMGLVRGHWEAKDTSDVLDVEISKKIKKGYPLGNIIFEDTRRAVLFQNKTEVMRVDLSDREQLARLLETFFAYTEPQIENFGKAVGEFKERVPEIATHLKAKITDAHTTNTKFKEAFASFLELCRSSLNPNITQDAVDDMLVQHLLTERLIREIFDNPEFTRRNVIAAEIEKVIDALTSKAFDRNVFLKSLDRFYVAIENAARTITEWSDKQQFLNTVYERFFQGYSVKLADTMGIVYTPQPIVDFMCASVAEVLEKEFGKSLGDKDVNILDPCTGTGNFIVNLIRRIPKKDLKRVYKEQLFANEIMLLPYYIAALNIEHAYFEQTGEYEPFEGLCFVDTLDLEESREAKFAFMTEKNTERVERQKRAPITVIIGNPPYNADQQSENENNPNRAYSSVDQQVRSKYTVRSIANNKNKMIDPYIRFFRWASDRLGDNDGVVVFITNNNFVHGKPFDGMRLAMLEEFNSVFHLDLNGDVRMNPKLSGTTHNVFGIQVGVGITLALRRRPKRAHKLNYFRAPEDARKEEKLAFLSSKASIGAVKWKTLAPSTTGDWIQFAHTREFSTLLPIASHYAKRGFSTEVVFSTFSVGNKSNRDEVVYDFSQESLRHRIDQLSELYNTEVDRYRRSGADGAIDDFIRYDNIKWSDGLKHHLSRGKYLRPKPVVYRRALWRPFTSMHLCFDAMLNDRRYLVPLFLPDSKAEAENKIICATGHLQVPFQVLLTRYVPSEAVGGRQGQCFPFYVYNEEGTNRRENITDWALDQFRANYKAKKIAKWDIFHYVYGVLHHTGYRTKFADNLRRALPRIPFAPDFWAFAKAGEKLAKLHLDYETLEPWKLKWVETPGEPLSYRVEKMKLSKDKTTLTVNKSLTLGGIPPEVFDYRLGNRSALEWVIDQYQVSEDKRSGIKSDPNREDDEEYIVRLVGQVVRVSMETVKIVNALPVGFA